MNSELSVRGNWAIIGTGVVVTTAISLSSVVVENPGRIICYVKERK